MTIFLSIYFDQSIVGNTKIIKIQLQLSKFLSFLLFNLKKTFSKITLLLGSNNFSSLPSFFHSLFVYVALENLLKVRWKEDVKDKHVNLTESQSRYFPWKILSSNKQTNAVMVSKSEWPPNHHVYIQHAPQAWIRCHLNRPIVCNMGQPRGLLN